MINDMHLARNSLIFKIAGILDDGSALHWSQVTASSLLGIGPNNEIVENGSLGGQPEESAACIHLGLRRIQPRAKVLLLALRRVLFDFHYFQVIFHTHTDYATALGCLDESTQDFHMIHQNGVRFYNRFAFHQDYGLPSIAEEAEAMGKSLGDKDVLFMCNHGKWK